jgi:hypothetical protein
MSLFNKIKVALLMFLRLEKVIDYIEIELKKLVERTDNKIDDAALPIILDLVRKALGIENKEKE